MPGGEAPPRIGVTTSEVRRAESVHPTPQGEPPRVEMALGLTYLRALERAGAVPFVIPPLSASAIDHVLTGLDGLCLSGGPDLHPANYGAAVHPELGPTEAHLDRLELELAREADLLGVPILAICRGAQALNVVRGGDLEQHLPDRSRLIDHRQRVKGERPTHTVRIERSSRLAELVGADGLEVNSFHHQAVRTLGSGLVAAAFADDGTVEAIEDPHRPFFLGVQWHAELLTHRAPERALFEGFVEACREQSLTASRQRAA
jgi:putative glutamine amidotransferase